MMNFAVVVNDEQYALWPAGQAAPLGWRETANGTRAECLDHIATMWTDMRPHGTGVERRTTHAHSPCIQDLFEAQVRRTPHAMAIVFEGQTLEYADLDSRADHVAHHLRSLGVGPEIPVAICVEPSLEMIVGLLGILKAGGAYVPLDPHYPAARLAFMLADSHAPVLLTQQRLLARLPDHAGDVVCLDRDWHAIAGARHPDASARVRSENLAYIVYTSGSTGQPKGVMVTHRNLAHSTTARLAYYRAPASRCLLLSSFAFDSSVASIFGTLCTGGTLYIPAHTAHADMSELTALIADHDISHILCVPAFYTHLLAYAPTAKLGSLRTVIVAGEECPRDLVEQHRLHLPQARLFNEYGPTEATVWSTVYECNRALASGLVPIGGPISGTQLYVLGDEQQPVPPGMPGELYIGGAGVARGYRNQPAMTAASFIPDPFGHVPGARLYRTGDGARFRPDGDLEFLGRLDQQVKVRGFRIEVGEVEVALRQHPGVLDAVVAVREDQPGDTYLAAYITSRSAQLDPHGLRAFVRATLPAYMVPAAFVLLDALPRTPNGKIDRQALPRPSSTQRRLRRATPAIVPRTPAEHTIAAAWHAVLGMDEIDVHDDFFALGGDSLAAARVLVRLREALGADLPLQSLFAAPTIAGFAELMVRTSPAKCPEGLALVPTSAMQRRDNHAPLSFAQQRLYFLAQAAPHSTAYAIPLALRLIGMLDHDALSASLQALADRHEALRTTFIRIAGEPRQVVASALHVPLPLVDLRTLALEEREGEALRRARSEATTPFALDHGPLLRSTLLQLADEEHLLLLTLHHLVVDGWSLGILWRELGILYGARVRSEAVALPPLPLQPADVARWQHASQQEQDRATEQLAYWRRNLEGAPMLDLPADRPRPAVQSYRGTAHTFTVDGPTTDALRALGRREGVTLFMTLLATFNILLARYSGQADIVVGTVMAGRTRVDLEELVGFFVNTVVLRTDLGGDPSVREVLGRVREAVLQASAHQDVPFDQLIKALNPPRDASRHPVFQVLFVLQSAGSEAEALALPGISMRSVEVDTGAAQFDLSLSLEETAGGLRGTLEYNTDLFDASTIDRLAGHYTRVLAGVVADPAQRMATVPLLDPAERRLLLEEWNATAADVPEDLCLHQLFATQAARTPEAVALIYEDTRLSYRELDQRANRLAHRLQSLGVGPDTLVGLCAERSPEMVVGLLGILKAGGAYVPLDPTYPTHRLAFMINDSQMPLLLTQAPLAGRLADLHTHRMVTVSLEDEWANGGEGPSGAPACPMTADRLAYVIYTSGSTGRPKGVLVEHQSAVNMALALIPAFAIDSVSRVLQFAALSFDVAVSEVFTALLAGATLVLAAQQRLLPGQPLLSLLEEQAITMVLLPSSALAVLPVAACLQLHTLVAGGEPCPAAVVERWAPGRRFVNAYGPTEATVCATWGLCIPASGPPSIGRPLANTQIYILDDALQPVPVGVPGELYIGGAGVARGYLNRPELTAERFITHPFSDKAGARLYRTGDRARWLTTGTLEFLGRLDQQIKIRGFRIEPGEVEAALDQHPSVQHAVVVAREDAPGDRRLVAYVVARGPAAPTGDELRRFLRERLPEHMVPGAYVPLDALPLTPNGKVDRRALPAPESGRPLLGIPLVAPRTATEQAMAEIWRDLLGIAQVGVHDSFFDLGGHSLLVVRLMLRLQETFGKAVPWQTFFAAPTVAGLARALDQAEPGTSPDVHAGTTPAARPYLEADSVLDPAIDPRECAQQWVATPAAIFITGATGFVGAFLLAELLDQTAATLHCLVRAADVAEGATRIRDILSRYGLWQEGYDPRIVPVPGDLAQPLFGLTEDRFAELAGTIDCIYHNGAVVNFVYPYQALKAANVLGTQEVIRLACREKLKPVHYVSTLDVVQSAHLAEARVVREHDPLTEETLDRAGGLATGYAQSKWVAEKLMLDVRARGLPVAIYRLGRVTGHSRSGMCNAHDLFHTLLKGCIHMGSAPILDLPARLAPVNQADMTPVDYIVAAIVALASRLDTIGNVFHLFNPQSLSFRELVAWLRAQGYALDELPFEDWHALLLAGSAGAEVHPLMPFLPLIDVIGLEVRAAREGRIYEPRPDCRSTLAALAGSKIVCPPVDSRLLEVYISYLVRSGFLQPPPPGSASARLQLDGGGTW